MSAPDDFQDRMLALGLGRVAEKAALATVDLVGAGTNAPLTRPQARRWKPNSAVWTCAEPS